jgi:hypothetical protein
VVEVVVQVEVPPPAPLRRGSMISPRPTLPPTTPSSATTLTPAMRGLSADDEADHLRECRRALGEMRDLAAEAFRARQSETCAFYADKALSTALALHSLVSARSPTAEEAGPADIGEDVILLAKAHHDMGSHMRAVHLLEQHRLLNISDRRGIEACTLASQCLLKGGKRSECLLLLDQVLGEGETGIGAVRTAAEKMALAGEGKGVNPVAALCAIRGAALATSDLSERARVWLKTALSLDNRCVYALQVRMFLPSYSLASALTISVRFFLRITCYLRRSSSNWLKVSTLPNRSATGWLCCIKANSTGWAQPSSCEMILSWSLTHLVSTVIYLS